MFRNSMTHGIENDHFLQKWKGIGWKTNPALFSSVCLSQLNAY